jgi:ankyrin repeat protein
MKKKAIQGVYVVFLIGCMVLVGLLTPSWGANKAEDDLINAAKNGDLALVKSLIAAGVDMNAKNNVGYTALIFASQQGHVEVVRALLAAKADMNAKDNDDMTALIRASQGGHDEVVKLLRQAGAKE